MSSIGTGTSVGTSVASVAHNAQQAARGRDKARGDIQRTAQEVTDRFELQAQAAGEASDPDAELPDHQAPGYEQLYGEDGDAQPAPDVASEASPATDKATATDPPGADPLYQHLDVKA